MFKRSLVVAASVVFAWLSMNTIALAQRPDPLSLTIRTRTEPLSLSRGAFQVVAILRNQDNNRRVVLRGLPDYSEAGGLTLRITDPGGTIRTLPATRGFITLEQARNGTRKLILKPGNGITVPRVEPANVIFPAPGTYRIQVSYQSPSPSSNNANAGRDGVEGATATSQQVDVTVVP